MVLAVVLYSSTVFGNNIPGKVCHDHEPMGERIFGQYHLGGGKNLPGGGGAVPLPGGGPLQRKWPAEGNVRQWRT